jgi:hypothetical protein
MICVYSFRHYISPVTLEYFVVIDAAFVMDLPHLGQHAKLADLCQLDEIHSAEMAVPHLSVFG